MIQVTSRTRILVAIEPVDFRRGIDGLARECRASLKEDPFCGTLFVFRNRGRTAVKVLAYDGQGFWLCQKRLSKGRFRYWPTEKDRNATVMLGHELGVLLCAGDPSGTKAAPQWRQVI